MRKILIALPAILVAFFNALAKKKARQKDIEEAAYWQAKQDAPVIRGELLWTKI